ncbi:MAG: hypothetical protein RL385_1093 [Pseudomonadota bacterium]|jgi:hypothetical protein
MTTPQQRKRGRPKTLPETDSISIPRALVKKAEELVPAFDAASAIGAKHSRTDVLRAAVAKGLEVLETQLEVARK